MSLIHTISTTSNLRLVGILLVVNAPIAFIERLIHKYIFSDIEFLKWLIVVCFLDLLTGICKVWVKQGYRAITSRGIRDTVSKIVQYGAFIVMTHILTHFEVNGKVSYFSWQWINDVAYEFLILIEIKSIYENIIAINSKLDFMKPILQKLNKYFQNDK